jgi:hypothetical protein
MRRDAKTLLDRLDRQEFKYHDFTEVAEEIELWPLFQALLRDTRIVGERTLLNKREEAAPDSYGQVAALRDAVTEAPKPSTVATLFDRYRESSGDHVPAREQQPSLREFLPQIGRGRS